MPEHTHDNETLDGDLLPHRNLNADAKGRSDRNLLSDQKVRILHDRVGTYDRGKVVNLSDFDDPQPLLDLGAITYVDDDEVDEPRAPTLYEAIHSESPPTLPNASYVDATPHEVRVASGLARPDHGNVGPGGVTYVGDVTGPVHVSTEQTKPMEEGRAISADVEKPAKTAKSDKSDD